jgi:hypothetical protein
MTTGLPVNADPVTWNDAISELGKVRFALENEEKSLLEKLKTVEERMKIQDEHLELLKSRLATLSAKPPLQPTMPVTGTESPTATVPAGETADRLEKETALITRSADRMVLLSGKDGSPGAAFLAAQDGKVRIFVSAQWLDKNPRPSVTKSDRSPLTVSDSLVCPVGVDLVCLDPGAGDLPHFELVETTEKPLVGARVVVILVDPETKRVNGIGGSIRGIGPDTLELDANLTPEMTGAPVLGLDSGRVVGVVAPQIAGVADDWAIGTRHQGSRNFANRIDRIQEWKTSDLARFANEATYIAGINRRTRIAWLAHMLVAIGMESYHRSTTYQPTPYSPASSIWRKDGESAEEYEKRREREKEEHNRRVEEYRDELNRKKQFVESVNKESAEHAANPHIMRVKSWIGDLRQPAAAGSREERLSNIYRSMLTDLKKQEPDLSGHMTWYHQQQYRAAQADRQEGIRIIAANADRVGL